MAGLINELITTLDELNVLYEQLIESATNKKKVIISNDLQLLQDINDSENTLVGKVTKLDKKRLSLFTDIAFVLNKNVKDVTINDIIEYIKTQDEVVEVRRTRDRANELLTTLRQLNEQNKHLIEHSLEHIEFSMNVVRSSLSNQPYYCDTQGNEIPTGKRLFDIKQ